MKAPPLSKVEAKYLVYLQKVLLRSGTSYVTVSYLIEDILVFGEDRPSEEVLNDTEVQDLVANGHTNPWPWLGGR